MTPRQKEILKNSAVFYKKLDAAEKERQINQVRLSVKLYPDHENALPAKIFLRIHKKL